MLPQALVILALFHGASGQDKLKPYRSMGAPCATAAECMTGYCTDGVCCDSACGGGDPNDCVACAYGEGVCTLVSGHVCRPSAAACDAEEVCDGSDESCPADGFAPAGTVCLSAVGPCDVDDVCDGTRHECSEQIAIDGARCESAEGRIGQCAAGECDLIPVDPIDETVGSGIDLGCACRSGARGSPNWPWLSLLVFRLRRRD